MLLGFDFTEESRSVCAPLVAWGDLMYGLKWCMGYLNDGLIGGDLMHG